MKIARLFLMMVSLTGYWLLAFPQISAAATTITYDVEVDWTENNPNGPWSYHDAINPLRPLAQRPNDSLLPPTNGSGPGFGNGVQDQGRVACCPFRVKSAFTQGTYVRFTNPTDATLSVFFELKPVNSGSPDQAVRIFDSQGQLYQGGGPVTLDLGAKPAGYIVEFAIVSLGCCGDVFDVDLKVTATSPTLCSDELKQCMLDLLAAGQEIQALGAEIAKIQNNLRTTFNNPNFVIPGNSLLAQQQNLATAILNLNATQKVTLYVNLGGTQPGPTIGASPTTLTRPNSVTGAWNGIASPSITDWIGIYAVGTPNTAYRGWVYTSSCQTSPSATPRASGTCGLFLPTILPAGNYELRLLANDGFSVLATSNQFVVQ